jgi:hypothetical protein
MNTWVLRAVFVGLLLASFMRSANSQQPADWTEQAPATIIQALSKQGLVVEKIYRLDPRAIPPVIAFKVTGCESALQVVYLHLSLTEAPFLDSASDPNYARRYIYLGRVWNKPDVVAMRLAWLKQRLLGLIGQSPFVMERMVLFVSSPPHCDAIERIDWFSVWKDPNSPPAPTGIS